MSRLIDADELKEFIKNCYCPECDNYNEVRCRACPTGDMLDALDDAPTVDQWHYPSKGEYPTDHTAKTRIVANNFGVTSAIYDWTEKRWYDNYNCHIPIDNVYAWCELPEPPKEEE